MAQQIFTRQTCDGHGAIDEPQTVEATQVRLNPHGRLNDLCEACAVIFDLFVPRLPTAKYYLNEDFVERLFRSGRDAGDLGKTGHPAQLTIPGTPAATRKALPKRKEADPESRPKVPVRHGRWIEGLEQVACPLEHPRAEHPGKYWVLLKERHGHAVHHGLTGPEIPYELPNDKSITLGFVCREHKVCADNGGYGHTTAAALRTHIARCNQAGWERVDGTTTSAAD